MDNPVAGSDHFRIPQRKLTIQQATGGRNSLGIREPMNPGKAVPVVYTTRDATIQVTIEFQESADGIILIPILFCRKVHRPPPLKTNRTGESGVWTDQVEARHLKIPAQGNRAFLLDTRMEAMTCGALCEIQMRHPIRM